MTGGKLFMEEKILLRWKKNGKEYWKTAERQIINKNLQSFIPCTLDLAAKEEIECIAKKVLAANSMYINWDEVTISKYIQIFFWNSDGTQDNIEFLKSNIFGVVFYFKDFAFEGKEIPAEITLEWKKNNKTSSKKIERTEVKKIFDDLISKHQNNNYISMKIVAVIPFAEKLLINWDNTSEENKLYYTICEGKQDSIQIPGIHKIVWGKLEKLFSDM